MPRSRIRVHTHVLGRVIGRYPDSKLFEGAELVHRACVPRLAHNYSFSFIENLFWGHARARQVPSCASWSFHRGALMCGEAQLRSARVSSGRIEMRTRGLERRGGGVNAEDDKGYTLRHTSGSYQCGPSSNERREKKGKGGGKTR